MKQGLLSMLLVVLFAVPAFATNVSVSYESDVVSAINPYMDACVSAPVDYSDVVSQCHTGSSKVNFYAVANQGHCSQGDLVKFVNNKQVKVVVGHNVLKQVGMTGYNQTVVNCVRVVRRVGFRPVRNIVRRALFRGRLVGATRRAVVREVDVCR